VTLVALFSGELSVSRLVLRAAPLALVALLATMPARYRLTRRVPPALVLFVLWAFLSYCWSADRFSSQRRLIDLGLTALLGWGLGAILGMEGLRRTTTKVFKVIVVINLLLIAALPEWASRPKVDDAPGWHALLGHKNALGMFAALAVATFWFERRAGGRRWLLAAVVLLVGSRSSTSLALLLVLAAAAMWNKAVGSSSTPTARAGRVGVSVLFVALGVGVFATQFDVITSLLGRGVTLSGRTEIWAASWRIGITQRPAHGFGLGGVWEAAVPPTSDIWKTLKFKAFHAHNGYLDILLQLGAVGLALFLAFVLPALARLSRQSAPAHRWGTCVIAALLLNGLAESSPLLGDGLLLLVLIASAVSQAPSATEVPPLGGPMAARMRQRELSTTSSERRGSRSPSWRP